ncbi:MAG TPA: hypothetical protein VH437_13300 [Terriglobales bacterium]
MTEKILLSLFLGAWVIPIWVAWPQRLVSPLWAWVRIMRAFGMFAVLELMVWFPGSRTLDWWFCAGVGVYAATSLVKRKPLTEHSSQLGGPNIVPHG